MQDASKQNLVRNVATGLHLFSNCNFTIFNLNLIIIRKQQFHIKIETHNRTNKDVTLVTCMSKKIYLWRFHEDILNDNLKKGVMMI